MKNFLLFLGASSTTQQSVSSASLAPSSVASSPYPVIYYGPVKHLGRITREELLADVCVFVASMKVKPRKGQSLADFEKWFVQELFMNFPTFLLPAQPRCHTLESLFRRSQEWPNVLWLKQHLRQESWRGTLARTVIARCGQCYSAGSVSR